MIRWLANTPSPQFATILNRLAEESPNLAVGYSSMGDRDRGWGKLELKHPRYVTPRGVKGFVTGIRAGMDAELSTLVVLGYADTYKIGALLGARIRGTRVFTLSDSNVIQDARAGRLKRLLKKCAIRTLFSKATVVWTISRENAEYWKYYGLKCQVPVPFESPVPVADSSWSKAQERRTEWLRDSESLALCIARVTPSKGVDIAVEAVRRLREMGVALRLVVVGAGNWYGDALDESAVELVGVLPRHELASAFLACDVFVLVSREEPYGLVIREALQFGLPVVASHGVPSARSLCDKGWNVVPMDDPMATANALSRALREERWDERPPVGTEEFYVKQLLE